jgi:hypothetical protein
MLVIYIHEQLNAHSHLVSKFQKDWIYTPNDLHVLKPLLPTLLMLAT